MGSGRTHRQELNTNYPSHAIKIKQSKGCGEGPVGAEGDVVSFMMATVSLSEKTPE